MQGKISFGNKSLTRTEVEREAHRLAEVHGLAAWRGDHGLALVSDDPISHVVAFVAAWNAGLRYTPLVPADSRVIERQLAIAAPDGVLESDGPDRWRRLSGGPAADAARVSDQPAADPHGPRDDPARRIVLFSSGTSGEPKGIVHSGTTLGENMAVHARLFDRYPGGTGIVAQNIQTTGFFTEVLKFLHHGRSLRLCPPHAREWLARAVRMPDADYLIGPVSVMRLLFGGLRRGERLAIPALVTYGEALTGRDLALMRSGLTDEAAIYQVYGLTEAPFIAGMRIPAELLDDADIVAIGQPLPGMALETGAGPDTALEAESARVALGYLGTDHARTAITPSARNPGHRRCLTGDVLSRDGQGRLVYRGRLDNQIKYGGHRYFLEELEARIGPFLATAWGATGHCLAPYPAGAGEPLRHLRLVVEGSPRADADDVLAACRGAFNGIREILFLADFPWLRTGKPDRRAIRAALAAMPAAVQSGRPQASGIPDLLAAAAALIGRAGLDGNLSWEENGGDSLDAVNLALMLEETHRLRIDPLALTSDIPVQAVFDAAERLPSTSD